jgi:heterodisulfide reductase subunit B
MLLGTLQNFSTQELVDCVTTCSGCGGGNVSRACIYLKTNEEILWDDYPYTGMNGTCQY